MRTYGSLALKQGAWIMDKIEPHVAMRLKHLFPRIPKAAVSPFAFQHDDMHCADLCWFTSRYPLAISPADREVLERGRAQFDADQAALDRILVPDYVPPSYSGLRDGQVIRPYQAQSIEVLFRRRSMLLGDDLGLGKTYQAAGFMLKPGALPAAVVVQTHLQGQWKEKIETFTTLRAVVIKKARPYDLPPADVYIYRYSQIAGWVDVFNLGRFKTVVFDEIQELRTGEQSNKGGAATVMARQADFRLGLSATPIYNYGAEMWNIMRVLDEFALGSYMDFSREWLDHQGKKVKDPQALGTFLREQHLFIRRTKRDVGQQVPPINRIIEIVENDDQAIADIADLARALAQKATSGSFTERGQAARELDLMVRHATGVSKARQVAAYVRILLEADMPILLLGWHRDVYEIWLRELKDFNPVMYTGSESPTQKEAAKQAFVNGKTNLFIMSLRSGAGLDGLQYRCSTVVFGELDWSPRVHDQIIGRLDREGQTEQVTAIYLNSEDGSDPPMVDLLGIKNAQSAGIVDPNAVLGEAYSDESRIRALAKQFLAKRGGSEKVATPAPAPTDLFAETAE